VKIGAKQRRYIIIGLGIIAVIALSYALLSQQLDGGGITDTVENKKTTLRKYMETIELEGPYEVDLLQYRTRLQQNRKRLMEGDSTNVAESELLVVLTDFAERNGVEITQKIVRKEEKIEDTLYKITAQIRMECNPDELVRYLTDIRNYNKFLTVEELQIQMSRTSRPTRNTRTPQPRTEMRPRLTVSGYIRIADSAMNEGGPGANS